MDKERAMTANTFKRERVVLLEEGRWRVVLWRSIWWYSTQYAQCACVQWCVDWIGNGFVYIDLGLQ